MFSKYSCLARLGVIVVQLSETPVWTRPMDLIAALLLLGVLVFDTVSHLCLKAASGRLVDREGLEYWRLLLTDPVLWLGVGTVFVLFFVWVCFLSRMPLGEGVMRGSITIIGVMLGGRLLFGERLTRERLTAISLIAIGVTLVGWGQS